MQYVSNTKPLFDIGRLVHTSGINSALAKTYDDYGIPYVAGCVNRHARGDWGEVCEDDAEANNRAMETGARIISSYPIDPGGPPAAYGDNAMWVITEADRSSTTVLLPSEY
jgi:hypothetical protein